jgi:hypothetical protein
MPVTVRTSGISARLIRDLLQRDPGEAAENPEVAAIRPTETRANVAYPRGNAPRSRRVSPPAALRGYVSLD